MVNNKIKIAIQNFDEEGETLLSEKSELNSSAISMTKEKNEMALPEEKKVNKKRGRPKKKKVDEEKTGKTKKELKKVKSKTNKELVQEEIEKKRSFEDKVKEIDEGENENKDLQGHELEGNDEEIDFKNNFKEKIKKVSKNIEAGDNLSEVSDKISDDPLLESPEEQMPKRSLGLYKKIALFFVLGTIGLLLVIVYFLFSSVTITLIPDQERINSNMIIDIYDVDNEDPVVGEKIAGIVKKITMEHESTYLSTGEDIIGEEVAGEVTIYNYYTKNQPLVATTRLLGPNNKLYRIKNTVNVPAGGSIKAEIYADEASPDMEIGPTKFTIPGLWAGLQDKIYAENTDKIEYSQRVKKYVTQTDIENSIRELKQELVKKAKNEINKQYKEYSQIIYSIDDNSVITDALADAGDEVDEFDVEISANIVAVAFDEKSAENLAEKKFISNLEAEKELIEFNRENIIYTLDNFDYREGTASVNATFEGKVSLRADENVVDKEKILGLNKDQLDVYLMNKDGISGYEVEFFPVFISKVPSLPDKIKIDVKR